MSGYLASFLASLAEDGPVETPETPSGGRGVSKKANKIKGIIPETPETPKNR